ncbi:MAG: 5'/3'-nucleotidase SurE [Candidatus Cloacimonetes bacterium]|nr:5'/3'-nucleotidase SurE [Candidatus Cloacimonadota bacterium]
MRILLTNDDGIDAPGINILGKYLAAAGHELTWCAPKTQQSAASHSITLHKPIPIYKYSETRYAVDGRPTDSVLIAYHNFGIDAFDLVISGINQGQNMAEDILYSGTVAAAIEACFLGYRSIAISVTSFVDVQYETAAHHLCKLLELGLADMIKRKEVLNINVPNVSIDEIKGCKITHPGHRRYENFVTEIDAPHGNKLYWISGDVIWSEDDAADTAVIQENYISISPIFPDFSKKEVHQRYQDWLKRICR